MSYEFITIVILIGVAVFFFNAYIAPAMRINAMKRQYQNIAEPRLLTQVGETGDEFYSRVERERARFRDVNNRWAQKQLPVIAIPFNRSFSIEWFGHTYDYNTVGLGQMEYHKMSLEVYIKLYEVWSRETSIFGERVTAQALGQKDFDPSQTWIRN